MIFGLFVLYSLFFQFPIQNKTNISNTIREEPILTDDPIVTEIKRAILEENIDLLIEKSKKFNFGCEQELMGDKPGKNVEECKTQDSFLAYSLGIIESNSFVISKKQYREFLQSFFNENKFEFVKEYKDGDFLYLKEDHNLGFLDKKQNVFFLVVVDQNQKLELAYQNNQNLFEAYLK